MRTFRRRALAALAAFLALTILGAAGYMIVEGAAFPDGLFMTLITITAVGYAEAIPLSPAGRIYTGILLIAGITWMGIWFAFLTSFLVELDLTHVLRSRRMTRHIETLTDHVIVCGVGRTGSEVVRELEHSRVPWVVIEIEPDQVSLLRRRHPDAFVVEGDATTDEELQRAGIDRARGLVAALSSDTDNLFICLSARDLNPELTIVARASHEDTRDKLFRAGASNVVSPEISGGIRMASMLLRPTVMSFLDVATRSSELSLRIEQMQAKEGDRITGRTLAEARIPQETGLIVIALRRAREGDDLHFNPGSATRIEAGDELVVLGTTDQVERLRTYLEA
ncbi:MAG: potassium channel protein [Longimicrobiales bacterium]|nr:potassium channel protein [Longimicrobiales bacterium]